MNTHHSKTFNKHGLKWSVISVKDRLRIEADIVAKKRAALIENLKAAGITGADFFSTVNDYDSRKPSGESIIFAYLNTPDGQLELFTLSLKKAGVAAESLDALNLSIQESTELLYDIMGIPPLTPEQLAEIEAAAKAEAEGGEAANPPTGENQTTISPASGFSTAA